MTSDHLREEIEREYVIETSGWAADRTRGVTERLQWDTPPDEWLETVVVWWSAYNAFTLPGKTIYISRRLLECMPHDDAAAFVIAHELAHHRLGHVPDLTSRWWPLVLAKTLLQRRIHSREHELDADRRAIEMCIAADYHPERCIEALEIIMKIVLDYGDVDGAFGGLFEGSHPALVKRIAAVRAHVEAL